jgi:hypothetical protein
MFWGAQPVHYDLEADVLVLLYDVTRHMRKQKLEQMPSGAQKGEHRGGPLAPAPSVSCSACHAVCRRAFLLVLNRRRAW